MRPGLAFGGFERKGSVRSVFVPHLGEYRQCRLSEEEMIKATRDLQSMLDNVHRSVQNFNNRRGKHPDSPPIQRPLKPANFQVGDYVMYAVRVPSGPHRKTLPKWTGPYQVVQVNSEFDFIVKHLVTGRERKAHATHMNFYSDSSLNATAELLDQIRWDESNITYTVEAILDFAKSGRSWNFLIRWAGFDEAEDSWEPLEMLKQDIPTMLKNYVLAIPDETKRRAIMRLIDPKDRGSATGKSKRCRQPGPVRSGSSKRSRATSRRR